MPLSLKIIKSDESQNVTIYEIIPCVFVAKKFFNKKYTY